MDLDLIDVHWCIGGGLVVYFMQDHSVHDRVQDAANDEVTHSN